MRSEIIVDDDSILLQRHRRRADFSVQAHMDVKGASERPEHGGRSDASAEDQAELAYAAPVGPGGLGRGAARFSLLDGRARAVMTQVAFIPTHQRPLC